ncbi:MAG: thiamine-binding protein [Eubacteriales bacterium]|nr:thiamine-binding protein [Eubacteriales bacterium]
MKVSLAIQVLPSMANDQEVCRVVDEAIDEIAKSGLNYVVAPFETTVEGNSMEELLDLIKRIDQRTFKAGAKQAIYYMKLAHGEEDILSIDDKIGKYQEHNQQAAKE